jgi:pimeloyl-ACP methyl ester carboxylesterase
VVGRAGSDVSDVSGEPPYESRRVAGVGGVGDVELAVDVWRLPHGVDPQRPGFVLIHGLASNARLYDGVAERLVAAGHAAASLDLRGHGRSDKPDTGYDYDTMCGDVAAVLDALVAEPGRAGFERPVVVGQSFGGNLVLELAVRYPGKLAGVGCLDGGTIDLAARFDSWEAVSEALAPPKIEGARIEELELRFFEWHPDWPEAGIRGSLANFEVRSDGTVAPWLTLPRHLAILRSMWESRPSEIYGDISVPVLIMPADSPGSPDEWAIAKRDGVEQAAAALGTVEVHWFSPADHDVHAQHPDQVAAVLLDAAGELFT